MALCMTAKGKEIRIDIKQDECSGPTASITSIEQIHNVFNGYSKGMKIKLKKSYISPLEKNE